MILKKAALFIILISVSLFASDVSMNKQTTSENGKDKIVCITIPKSGTHLLLKCLTLFKIPEVYHVELDQPPPAMVKRARELNQNPPPNHYKGQFHIPTVGPLPIDLIQKFHSNNPKRLYSRHWPYTKPCEAFFNKHTCANFLMIRDPRDQLISMAYMVYQSPDKKREISLEKVIFDLIDGRQKSYIPWAVEIQEAYPLMWELGVVGFYNLYLPWMNARNFYTVKFENLIGCHGGGSKETQEREIKNIANHIGLKLSHKKAKKIITKIFGGTRTFRAGQISSWKKHFTPEIKKTFKNTPGANELLIKLGYEKNDNW